MDAGREEVVGVELDETAVGSAFGEHGEVLAAAEAGGDVPAEDGGVEGLDALEVGAGDFGPGDHLMNC